MRLDKIYCPNKHCRDYKNKGGGNISVVGYYGKKNRYRLLRCKTCGLRFSERRWSIFFGMHTDEGTIRKTLVYLLGGKSIRETAKEVGLDKDTVQRIWRRVVEKWERAVREFLEDINLHDIDFEKLLSFPPVNLWRGSFNKKRRGWNFKAQV